MKPLAERIRPWWIAVAAVGLTAVIYVLPGAVATRNNPQVDSAKGLDQVANSGRGAGAANVAKATTTDPNLQPDATAPTAHATPLDETTIKDMATLRKALGSTTGEARIEVAKQMAARLEKATRYDSAARYRMLVAEMSPTITHNMAAGEANFNAFSMATTPEVGADYGNRARLYYSKVLLDNPRQLSAKVHMGMTWIGTETPMKGIALLREVISVDPANLEANYNLGVLSMQTGQHAKAVERFQTVVKNHPEHEQARFFLAVSLKQTNQPNKAVDQLRALLKITKDPEVQATAQDQLQQLGAKP